MNMTKGLEMEKDIDIALDMTSLSKSLFQQTEKPSHVTSDETESNDSVASTITGNENSGKDDNVLHGKNQRSSINKKILVGVAILISAAVVFVVIDVISGSQARRPAASNGTSSPSSSVNSSPPVNPPTISTLSPTTATQPPTSAPVSRLQAFRSILLDHKVSSYENLYNQSTPQYRALEWLTNKDPFKLQTNASVNAIIGRYVVLVIFFQYNNGDGGYDPVSFTARLCAASETNCSNHELQELHLIPSDLPVLSGTFLTELGMLTSLTRLALSGRRAFGTIPTELGKLSRLIELSLTYSRFTGTIPTELGMLTSLTELHLLFNRLTGTNPTEFGKLSMLIALDSSNNKLTGRIPTELGQLSNISALLLETNQLTGMIPTQLAKLSSLRDLYLDDNKLTGTIPTEIGELAISLEYLTLSSNRFTGTIPSELPSGLLWLYLSNSMLTGTVPAALGALLNIDNLYQYTLDHNNFTGNLTAIFCTRSIPWVMLESDCDRKVDCSCCTTCY